MDGNSETDSVIVGEISKAQTPLRAYIWKLVGDRHHTDDILQETNLVIWQKRADWDSATVFLKWAYRIAYFQTKAHFRDAGRDKERLVFTDAVLETLAKDTPRFHENSALEDALEHCLEKMDSSKRSLLMQRYDGENSLETIAKLHNRQPNTLSQMLRRLRSQLSSCIEAQTQN
ncbi:sigma-70 family RNA polymerase sigma factor [Luteolibacter algae]|uniref:Sigma-70 family RNA polymerase sigma factor n=1 Tax=Luteolibacter algae TaxID=454151 RepID=A0ABW5D4H8_9BACT